VCVCVLFDTSPQDVDGLCVNVTNSMSQCVDMCVNMKVDICVYMYVFLKLIGQ